jgi:hypothetical protein
MLITRASACRDRSRISARGARLASPGSRPG